VIDLDARDLAGLARTLSLVENGGTGADQLLASLQPKLGRAHRIGVTGPPGAGKSTLTQALVRSWRETGQTVAIVAVDPTSPVSGGALLGDRIRMDHVAQDTGVFIRSMATRGALGGLALTTGEVCDVLDAAGFDRVVVETVGVGQSELDVVSASDTTVVVLVPESGDGIQTLKSGLMEIGDVFVVNKADRPGAERLLAEIGVALDLRSISGLEGDTQPWRPPALATAATSGEGVAELVEAIGRHRSWLENHGQLEPRRRKMRAAQARAVLERAIGRWARETGMIDRILVEHADDLEAGGISPYELSRLLLETLAQLKP
jgi:LAO/AO transport system kinase